MKKYFNVKTIFIFILSILLFMAVNAGYCETNKIIIRVGGVFTKDSPVGQGLEIFKEKLEKMSDKVEVQVFHNCELGSEGVQIQGLQSGEIQMCRSGTAGIGLITPLTDIPELPYLYNSKEIALKTWDYLIDIINEETLKKNIRIVSIFDQGTRSLISRKPVRKVEDLKGFRLRVPQAKLYVGMADALGAKPVSIAFQEVYTALQTGIADGMEGPPATVFSSKFYEPCKYFILTKHIQCGGWFIINEKFYQSLPKELQEKLLKAAREAAKEQREISIKEASEYVKKIEESGVEIIEIKDLGPFKELVKNFNEEYVKEIGEKGIDLLNKINDYTSKFN